MNGWSNPRVAGPPIMIDGSTRFIASYSVLKCWL